MLFNSKLIWNKTYIHINVFNKNTTSALMSTPVSALIVGEDVSGTCCHPHWKVSETRSNTDKSLLTSATFVHIYDSVRKVCMTATMRLCSLQHDRWLSPSRRRCQYLHSAFLAQLSNITNKYNLIWTSVSHATQILRTETALKSPPFSVIVIVKPRIMLDISTCCHSAPNDFTHTHLLSAQRRATTQTLWHEEKKRNTKKNKTGMGCVWSSLNWSNMLSRYAVTYWTVK